jgi:hypothetical protein
MKIDEVGNKPEYRSSKEQVTVVALGAKMYPREDMTAVVRWRLEQAMTRRWNRKSKNDLRHGSLDNINVTWNSLT